MGGGLRFCPMQQTLPLARLIVRYVAERHGDQWQAFTLEFGLAAQADSQADVQHKLESMIRSYVSDALTGEDREHADVLLNRRATLSVYAKYYLTLVQCWLARHLGGRSNGKPSHMTFKHPLPLGPVRKQSLSLIGLRERWYNSIRRGRRRAGC